MRWFKKLILVLVPTVSWAAFPGQFTYQGSLKQNGALVNGTYQMEFRLTNSDGSQTYWTSGAQNIAVQEGLYRVELSPSNVSWGNVEPYIQVSVNGNILLPREKLNSAPYALMAKELAPNAVGRGDFQLLGRLSLVDPALAGNQDAIAIQAPDAGTMPFQLKLGYRSNTAAIQANRTNVGPQSLLLNPEGGNVGIGLTQPSQAALTIYRHDMTGGARTNTLFGAGYSTQVMDGNRQFWIQQWLHPNTARTFLVGNGYIDGFSNGPIPHDGPSTKFQAIEFQDSRFGFVYNDGTGVTSALSVNPTNGYVGIGTGDQTSRLEVAGDVEVHGMVKNENNKPAFFVSVYADDCGWGGRPYLGCPSGYTAAGRWHTGPDAQCNSALEGEGYENGQLDKGWMVMCVAQ